MAFAHSIRLFGFSSEEERAWFRGRQETLQEVIGALHENLEDLRLAARHLVTSPESSLAAAIQKAPTAGVLWTSENVGYSIKYAYRLPQPDGGERIILATDRPSASGATCGFRLPP